MEANVDFKANGHLGKDNQTGAAVTEKMETIKEGNTSYAQHLKSDPVDLLFRRGT